MVFPPCYNPDVFKQNQNTPERKETSYMKYNFDEIINRKDTISSKWDNVGSRIGNADALPMWVADMDFCCPQPVIDAVEKRAEFGIYGYPYLVPEFKEVTQAWVKRRYHWDIETDSVIFAASIIPALFNGVQALTKPGEKVIIQRPVYYPFSYAIEDNGRVVSNNSLILKDGKYEIDFEDLEERLAYADTNLMILCNPHNPTGRVYTPAELRTVGELCIKHHVTLFSDEIHADFIYEGHAHTSVASLSPEIANNTITAIAPSKTFNLAGMRTACLIISNPDLRKTMEKVFNDNRSALVPTFGLDAYIAAYRYGDEYIDQLVPYLQTNINYLNRYLKAHMPKIKLIQPEGTYLLWLDCRELGLEDEQLDQFFIQDAAVAVDKGYWFGTEGSGFMRINIACPKAYVEQAMVQLRKEYEKL